MSLTITVEDPIAKRLKSRADAENIPVEELASRLLANNMKPPLDPEKWSVVNHRRVALIHKQFDGGLTEVEELELENLQEVAERQVAELDALMLKDVARMEAAARRIISGAE